VSQNRTPAIIGFLFAGAVILLLGFFGDRIGTGGDDAPPALRILAPTDSAANPVVLRFRTDAPLELHPGMGWMADELHLHAMVDDVEIMPAAADLRAAGDAWEWQLPPLEPGTHRIYLTWAGRHHGNLAGDTDTVRVIVR